MSSNGTTNGKSELALARAARAALKVEPAGGAPLHLVSAQRQRLDRDALTEWMRAHAHPKRGKRRAVLFTLAHRTDKGGLTAITEADVPKRMGELEREDAIAQAVSDFDRAAETWAQGANRPQTFFVGAHTDDDPDTRAHVTFPFTYSPPPEARDNFEGNEKADNIGALAQYQRSIDTVLRVRSTEQQQDKDRWQVELDSLRRHNEELMRIRVENIAQREELADAAALRAVQVKKTELEMEVTHKVTMAALSWGLPFIAKLLGADEQASGDGVFMAFVQKLRPEQIADLLGAFKNLDKEQEEAMQPILAALFEKLPDAKKNALGARMVEMEAKGEIIVDVTPQGEGEGGSGK